jgi:hypothetical protein
VPFISVLPEPQLPIHLMIDHVIKQGKHGHSYTSKSHNLKSRLSNYDVNKKLQREKLGVCILKK